MEDQFGYWLSGLIDGEGCFQVAQSNQSYWCKFTLTQRDDDGPMIHTIRSVTALGTTQAVKARASSKPQITWVVSRQEDCLELVSLLDRYPLRSRKRRDYQIWREAVKAWNEFEGYKRLPEFQARIREARTYQAKLR